MIWPSYLLKTVLIQLIAFGCYKLLLDKEPLGHWKRAYLLGSLLLSFVIPLMTVPQLFTQSVNVFASTADTVLAPDRDLVTGAELLPPTEVYALSDLLLPMLVFFYTLGALAYFARMLMALRSVKDRLSRATSTQELAPGVQLIGLAEPTATHTFLRWIFFHEAAPPAKEVLAHELAHVRQWHSIDRLFIGVLQVLFWFNPLLRYYERAIRVNHELLADQAVLRQGINPVSYQQQLLAALRRPASPALSSGVDFNLTKKRFQMMHLTKANGPRALVKLLTAGMLWAVLLFSFGQTSYAQTAPPPPPPPKAPKATQHRFNVKQAIPSARQLATWGEKEDNQIRIDSRKIKASELKEYQSEDFSQYYVLAAPEGSGDHGLHVYLFTEKEYPWPNVPPPPPPFPPMPPKAAPQAPPAPPAPHAAVPAPPAPPSPPLAAPPAPPAPPSGEDMPPPPPPMDWNKFKEKVPTSAQLEEWQDSKQFGVWIDRKQIANEDLANFSPDYFSHYKVSKLMRNAKNYGKYPYQVSLMTTKRLARLRRQQRN